MRGYGYVLQVGGTFRVLTALQGVEKGARAEGAARERYAERPGGQVIRQSYLG